MSLQDIAALGKLLGQFLSLFADCFRRPAGRLLLAVYVRGLLSNVQRKNVEALLKPREPAKLRQDVLEMRAEMARHKPAKGPLDVKLARGGLVDLEFIVHHQQLRYGEGLAPGLEVAIELLVDRERLPPVLIGAREALARLLVSARLIAPDGEMPPPAAREVLAKACLCSDWDAVLAGSVNQFGALTVEDAALGMCALAVGEVLLGLAVFPLLLLLLRPRR